MPSLEQWSSRNASKDQSRPVSGSSGSLVGILRLSLGIPFLILAQNSDFRISPSRFCSEHIGFIFSSAEHRCHLTLMTGPSPASEVSGPRKQGTQP